MNLHKESPHVKKPIGDKRFWHGRLDHAEQIGDLRDSVYRTTDEDWKKIDAVHKAILNKYILDDDMVLDAGC